MIFSHLEELKMNDNELPLITEIDDITEEMDVEFTDGRGDDKDGGEE